MKKNKNLLVLAILLLTIGFAAVVTTIYINGTANISGDQSEFTASVVFTDSSITGGSSVISTDGKTITFTTADLKSLNQTSVLSYTVTNNSTQYDADVDITCVYNDEVVAADKNYIEWTNDITDVVEAKTSENGTVTVKLINVAEETKNIKIDCTLSADALERDTVGESQAVTP